MHDCFVLGTVKEINQVSSGKGPAAGAPVPDVFGSPYSRSCEFILEIIPHPAFPGDRWVDVTEGSSHVPFLSSAGNQTPYLMWTFYN